MVKLSLDTNRDAIADLEEALEILQEAITRRKAEVAVEKKSSAKSPKAQELIEETAIDTPFFKVTVESEPDESEEQTPTLNEMLSSESITEDELTEMFKQHGDEKKEKKAKKKESEDAFIEIVEFEDEEEDATR